MHKTDKKQSLGRMGVEGVGGEVVFPLEEAKLFLRHNHVLILLHGADAAVAPDHWKYVRTLP